MRNLREGVSCNRSRRLRSGIQNVGNVRGRGNAIGLHKIAGISQDPSKTGAGPSKDGVHSQNRNVFCSRLGSPSNE
jgi:hypothetical protein